MSIQPYLSTWPRKNRLRSVPFSRRISARSTYVHEHRPRAPQHERVRGGNERERRQDDLVAGTRVDEQRRHLERVRAGGGQERLLRAGERLEQRVDLLRERAVSGDAHVVD